MRPLPWAGFLWCLGVMLWTAPTSLRAQEPEPTVHFQADYLLWFLKHDRVREPIASTVTSDLAVPGPVQTRTLYGQQEIGENNPLSGLRLRAAWMATENVGIDFRGFILERGVDVFRADPASTLATTSLVRPIIDATDGQELFNVLNLGTQLAGSIVIENQTKVWGAEIDVLASSTTWCGTTAFAGYRYLGVHERLNIEARSTVQLGGLGFFNGLPVGEDDTRVQVDDFQTQTAFHGAQIGLLGRYSLRGGMDLALRSAVALGVSNQNLKVNGTTTVQPSVGTPQTLDGGLLALPSNTRSETRNVFAVVPEIDLTLGCQVASWLRLSVGYNLLYCSSVVRPGDQVTRTINTTQVPVFPGYQPAVPASNPAPLFRQTDFWAQGLNFGVSVAY